MFMYIKITLKYRIYDSVGLGTDSEIHISNKYLSNDDVAGWELLIWSSKNIPQLLE